MQLQVNTLITVHFTKILEVKYLNRRHQPRQITGSMSELNYEDLRTVIRTGKYTKVS